jgi:hypothetical protein
LLYITPSLARDQFETFEEELKLFRFDVKLNHQFIHKS